MKLLSSLLVLLLSLPTLATVKIEEEIFVMGESPKVIEELIMAGSVEIDHVSPEGFEVYGPRGLGEYLNNKGLNFLDLKSINKSVFNDYPSYKEITQKLHALVEKYSHIMQLSSIGKSVQGRELWMVKISDNVHLDENEPKFKYISSMHGDEITGRELSVMLIEEIGKKYGQDEQITSLVDNTEIYIMPSMNPDGSEMRQRANARGRDLNRNFPDITRDQQSTPNGREAETQAVMKFQSQIPFALSANFHGGAVVANYPWDSTYDPHPLEDFIKDLSLGYANLNPEMRASRQFPGGITNGADWYVVRGGMQDWSYFWHDDLQITLELSQRKWPLYSTIPGFYRDNRDALFYYMAQVHQGAGLKFARRGVEGVVHIQQTSPAQKDFGSFAFSNSYFYKVIPAGSYVFSVTEKGGKRHTLSITVEEGRIKHNGNFLSLR